MRARLLWLALVVGTASGARADDAPPPPELREPAPPVAGLRDRARGGDARAWGELGVALELGRGVQRDRVGALVCFRRAAELGDAVGRSWLAARLQWESAPGRFEYDTGRDLFLQAASEEPFARGYCLRQGAGLPYDPEASVQALEEAAAAGDPRAMTLLGLNLLRGYQETDEAAGIAHLASAAAAGWTKASLLLGGELEAATPPRLAEALARYAEAEAAGDLDGALFAARLHLTQGRVDLARPYLERAAAAGRPDAHQELAALATDPASAVAHLERGAALGGASCMALLGRAHELGAGVPQSADAARGWYRRAVAARARIFEDLAVEAEFGRSPDPAEARRWYRRGISIDDPHAMTALAEELANGYPVEEGGPAQARSLYERAAALGHPPALQALGALLAEDDPAAGLPLLERAAALGEPEAMLEAGRLRVARGGRDDRSAAAAWFRRAADAGQARGLVWLGLLEPDRERRIALYDQAHRWRPGSLAWVALALPAEEQGPLLEAGAERGDLDAMCRLGDWLLRRDGDAFDAESARGLAWIERAAAKGHEMAMFELGLITLHGNGAEQSDEVALAWFRKAVAAKPNPTASKLIEEILARRPDLR